MFKTSANQPRITDKLIDGGYIVSGGDIDGFGSKSNKKSVKSRKSTIPGNSGATEESKFLTSKARKAFNLLWQAFTKAPILWHFDLESYIRIETDVSSYVIDGVLSQLISD